MSHPHSAKHEENTWVDRERYRVLMQRFSIPLLMICLLTGIIILKTWPVNWTSNYAQAPTGFVSGTLFHQARVTQVEPFTCVGFAGTPPNSSGQFDKSWCANVKAKLTSGAKPGRIASFDVEPKVLSFGLKANDPITLAEMPDQSGTSYFVFQDFDRRQPLELFIGIFVLIVLLISGTQGLRALLGLAIGAGLALLYIVPTLALGLNVSVILGLTIPLTTIVMLFLGHGYTLKSIGAIIGTLFGSLIALGGSLLAVAQLRLTGLTSDDDAILMAVASKAKLSNLLIASIVIAGLGALNDVTVTQSSAVWELGDQLETHGKRWVFRKAMRIGRDHVASSIYTISFAYVGSALVTLMLIMLSKTSMSFLLNSEVVGQEIALVCVGLGALMLSMPVTTACSVWLAHACTRKSMPS